MRRSVAVSILVATATLLAGCTSEKDSGSATASSRPSAPPVTDEIVATERPGPHFPDGWTPPPLTWEQCGLPGGGQCATLPVPIDWAAPDGPTVNLRVGRIPASGTSIGPLITNPGGPGASGLQHLGYFSPSEQIRQEFDLVSWDPRGVGESDQLDCDSNVEAFVTIDPDPDDPAEKAQLEAAAESISSECAAAGGELINHLNTGAVANDLEAIRLALDAERINFVGYSYGTKIGQEYLARFPTHVRAMVLDGVVDPAQTVEEFLLDQTRAFDEAFNDGAAACAAAGVAVCGVKDLAGAYDQVAELVEAAPISAGSGRSATPATLATAAVFTSYINDGWQELGPALAEAQAGRGAPLVALAGNYYNFGGYAPYAAVVCTDAERPEGNEAYAAFADRAREVSPRFGGSVANEMLPCATWPAPSVGLEAPISVTGGPHVLVIGNTGDAATPIENAQRVAERLDPSTLITVESDGHTAYTQNACVDAVVDAYLLDLTVPESDLRC